jgi:hypothetical protein
LQRLADKVLPRMNSVAFAAVLYWCTQWHLKKAYKKIYNFKSFLLKIKYPLKEKEEEKILGVVETSEVVEMDNYTNTEVCIKTLFYLKIMQKIQKIKNQ